MEFSQTLFSQNVCWLGPFWVPLSVSCLPGRRSHRIRSQHCRHVGISPLRCVCWMRMIISLYGGRGNEDTGRKRTGISRTSPTRGRIHHSQSVGRSLRTRPHFWFATAGARRSGLGASPHGDQTPPAGWRSRLPPEQLRHDLLDWISNRPRIISSHSPVRH